MLSKEALVQQLSNLVGREHVVAGKAALPYSVDMTAPMAVVFPESVNEVSAIMAFASAEGLKIVPRGSGTKMGFGRVPEQLHVVLALSRLNGMVDHEPADMIATFQAGTPLREAQALLARNGQRIALDPPFADLATIGGILATNSSGPLRLRYGTSRDLVLAIRVVHADGKVTKGGAKVVKNVTGYDMNKLYIGSLGTLAIIVEATFRLFPSPAFEKTYLAAFASIDTAQKVIAKILDSRVVASAVELLNPEASCQVAEQTGIAWKSGSYGLAVAVASVRREAVEAQLVTVRQLCDEAGDSEGDLLNDQVQATFWRMTRDIGLGDGPRAVLKASVRLTRVGEGMRLGQEVAAKLGLGLGIVSEAGSGIIRYYLSGDTDSYERFEQGVAETVKRLRTFAQEAEGSLVVLEAPAKVKGKLDVWGSVGNALPLMQRLKEQFDPERVLNPGRFVGGI
jgi:glycolate oxidase FAD binding subunit